MIMKGKCLTAYPKDGIDVEVTPFGQASYYVDGSFDAHVISNIHYMSLYDWENCSKSSWQFNRYFDRDSRTTLYYFEGHYYSVAGMLRIAHERGNEELTESSLRNRVNNITDGREVPEDMLLKLMNLRLRSQTECSYLGKSVTIGDVLQLAKQHNNILTKTLVTNRLHHGWSVYRIITTPAKEAPNARDVNQYNRIANLVEKYGREKGLKIWLGHE